MPLPIDRVRLAVLSCWDCYWHAVAMALQLELVVDYVVVVVVVVVV